MYNAVSGAETCNNNYKYSAVYLHGMMFQLKKISAYAEIRYITRRDTAPHRLLFQ